MAGIVLKEKHYIIWMNFMRIIFVFPLSFDDETGKYRFKLLSLRTGISFAIWSIVPCLVMGRVMVLDSTGITSLDQEGSAAVLISNYIGYFSFFICCLCIPICLAKIAHEVNPPTQFLKPVIVNPGMICLSLLPLMAKYALILAIFYENVKSYSLIVATITTYLALTMSTLMDISTLTINIFCLLLKQQCKETGSTVMEMICNTKKSVTLYNKIVKGSATFLLVIYSLSTLLVISFAYFVVKDPGNYLTVGSFYVVLGLKTILFLSWGMEDAYEAVKDLNEIHRCFLNNFNCLLTILNFHIFKIRIL